MEAMSRGPLEGLTVVEVGSFVAGPAMASLLWALGATVIKIEQPSGGDPSRQVSPWGFLNYNYGKKSVCLNLKEKKGQEILHKLVSLVDVFIENLGPGVGERLGFSYQKLSSLNPALVYCSIKGFAGDDRSYDRPAFDAVAQALSGTMALTGEPGGPPLRIGNPSVDLGAAAYGVIGVLSSLLLKQRGGDAKKGAFIEISLLDMSVYWNGYWFSYYGMTGNEPQRLGSGHPGYCPHRVFKTQDEKFVFLAALSDSHWPKLERALGLDLGEEFRKAKSRLENRELVEGKIAEVVSKLSLDQVIKKLEENEVPSAPVRSVPEVYSDATLKERKILVEVKNEKEEGRIVDIALPPVARPGRAVEIRVPSLGEDTEEVLSALGYSIEYLRNLRESGVI